MLEHVHVSLGVTRHWEETETAAPVLTSVEGCAENSIVVVVVIDCDYEEADEDLSYYEGDNCEVAHSDQQLRWLLSFERKETTAPESERVLVESAHFEHLLLQQKTDASLQFHT